MNALYVDWELDKDELKRRGLKIAKGLGLSVIPSNLLYYSPDKSLYKLLPKLRGEGEKINQKRLILQLKEVLGKDRIIFLLDKGIGIFWDKLRGWKREFIYKFKILKSGYIYKPNFRILENESSEDEIELLEVIA